jgi:flagellar motor switch protein FliN/FliY
MDETHDKDQPEQQADGAAPEEQPAPEDAAAQPAPEASEAQPNSESDSETPDAIKAMGNQPVADDTSEAAGAGEESGGEEITINEPSMDFSNPIPADAQSAEVHRAEFPQLGDTAATGVSRNIHMLMDVRLPVSIELGRTTLSISDILEWGQGSVIELDKLAGEPVDLLVNNKLVARGEVVVIDEKFGMRITSLIAPPDPTAVTDTHARQGEDQ